MSLVGFWVVMQFDFAGDYQCFRGMYNHQQNIGNYLQDHTASKLRETTCPDVSLTKAAQYKVQL
jgi:hypothetical protein